MTDIFLSYASSDRDKAQAIAAALTRHGFDVFFDRNIPAGMSFGDSIGRALDEAKLVVVLWSTESTKSKWVRSEASAALERNRLMPVLIEDTPLPVQFRAIETVDLTEWNPGGTAGADEFNRLIRTILHKLGVPPGAPPSKRPTAPDRSRGTALGRWFDAMFGAKPPPTQRPRRKYDVFLSYRRSDSAYATGHISERLEKRFGAARIFKDVDTIGLAEDFRQSVDDAVANCQIMVAVIGSRWTGPRDDGSRRIDDARDLVRIELESALKRSVSVVPVLIEGIEIPQEQDLPETLKTLPYLNGAMVRPDPDFNNDVGRLLDGLATLLKKETAP